MGNVSDCPFKPVCVRIRIDLPPCASTSIDKNECAGPVIKGRGILNVANISSGSHKIAIMSQCPECNKILGIVTGDTEPIPYRADSVVLSDGMKKRIPKINCESCNKAKFAFLATAEAVTLR